MIHRWGLASMLACSLLAGGCAMQPVQDVQKPAAIAQTSQLVPFASDEGLLRLSRATARADFAALANQFEAQSNAAFCGPTTAAIVLNTIRAKSPDLPRDRSRLSAQDQQYVPGGFDLSVARYTQENVITKGRKTRAQVLGEPLLVNGKSINDFGYQTRQLDEMLRANGVATQLVIVDDAKPEADIRSDLVRSLGEHDSYAIVTYKRAAVGQTGGGHISPLGAYDAASDSFLVMDVNPSSAGWVWMPTALLVKGMRTFDTLENRGYILLRAP
jgi:Phytochelatin synthase